MKTVHLATRLRLKGTGQRRWDVLVAAENALVEDGRPASAGDDQRVARAVAPESRWTWRVRGSMPRVVSAVVSKPQSGGAACSGSSRPMTTSLLTGVRL